MIRIQKAARESAIYQRDLWEKSEREALEAVREAGVEVITPDKSLFSEKTSDLYRQLLDSDELLELYDQIKNVAEVTESH